MEQVIIIGAGLSGLALANSLEHHGIPYQVFERGQPTGDQGWSLSLHFGWHALKRILSQERAAAMPRQGVADCSNPFGSSFSIVDLARNKVLMQMPPPEQRIKGYPDTPPAFEVYRINRKRFRQWLLDGLGEHKVTWHKQLLHYKLLANGGVEAYFDDGSVVKGAVIVGADGVHSKVCSQLMGPDRYADATTTNPVQVIVCNRWTSADEWLSVQDNMASSVMGYGGKAGIFCTLNDVDHVLHPDKPYQVLCAVSTLDLDPNDIPSSQQGLLDTAQKIIVDNAYDPANPVVGLVRNASVDQGDVLTYLTVRERSPDTQTLTATDGRVTLIGDAAHTMTMYRGEGGNHAIVDAVQLGDALSRAYQQEISLVEAVQSYLQEMLPRGATAVQASHEAADLLHRSPDKLMQIILQQIERNQAPPNNHGQDGNPPSNL
ncbi:FAD/NAD(P)-binding domain-containing protein [Hesseltinella vesiculosa]|uniref:FAD/NAD(P)-binding domain-containing protein n=1 Tax=Hesseltinella vesiculosa TaxID=101127 RepID=A0A1X2GQ52_9FUNG|nr:FAD/NAD(P)-binding domain-containing protein [Hesseltinella vesiculosa]